MEANNINHEQTATKEQSDLGPFCLQHRLLMNISRQAEETTKVVTGELRVIFF